MKQEVKNVLSRSAGFQTVDFVRQLPAMASWIKGGCRGPAPGPVKRTILGGYLKAFDLRVFIETGTLHGDTLAAVATDATIECESIELSEHYYRSACERFQDIPNVKLHHGDSAVVLPQIVEGLNKPALFWLDGHYSGGRTARGNLDTPVSLELRAILRAPVQGHVILIDDVRCFNGTHDYPNLDELLAAIRHDGRYEAEISADILRLVPQRSDRQ
jgi:hypothetical protein